MTPNDTELTETLRLTSLDVENILRIKAVHLVMDDDGAMILEGGNEAGKSSVIDALEMVLGGGKVVPDDPIHGDKQQGHVIATFGDLVVEKVFRRGKSPTLKVTVRGGAPKKAPQSIINSLLAHVSLDPLKFMEMDDEKKAKTISDMMGFDSSKLDAEIADAYERRKTANGDSKRLEGAVASLQDAPPELEIPDSELSVAKLLKDLEAAQKHNSTGDETDAQLQMCDRNLADANAEIAELQEQIKELAKHIDTQTAYRRTVVGRLGAFVPIDEGEIKSKIDNAEKINAAVRDKVRRAALLKEWEDAVSTAGTAGDALKSAEMRLEAAREEAQSRLPVPGLALANGIILYKNKPLSQAGASAELRISTAIAIALNQDKPIKLLCIDDAEKLDNANTLSLVKQARDAGFQVIMARTRGDGPPTVIIEDGMIAAVIGE